LGHHAISAIIFSRDVIPPDAQHLLAHAGAVNQRINAGSSAVSPLNRDFFRAETKFPREEENLRIESPPLYPFERENKSPEQQIV
jgi:hypothetical protein